MNRDFLARCEQEALHRSGAIQDHGTLLALDAVGRVSHVAANIGQFLGGAPEDWLGRPLPVELAALAADLPDLPGSRRFLRAGVEGLAGGLDLSLHRGPAGEVLLELTPEAVPSAPDGAALPALADPPADEAALARVRQALLEEIARRTGAQRVMFYAFHEQGDGEVIAETRQGPVFGSYLGLRFPASDIPRIARALYLKNPWRLIPDARREPVPLLGRDAAPPDLTWSDLRSVSPVHRVYLANMGVTGSLSFPVVVGNALAALRAQSRMRMIDNLVRRFSALRLVLHRHGDLVSAWPEVGPLLQHEFRVDGAMLCLDDCLAASGQGFEPPALAAFDDWFCREQRDLVWGGDHLRRQVPDFPLSEIAGVLALRVHAADGDGLRLYLTRCEHIHEVAWGGNPDKPVDHHDGVLGIAPRRSFEKWVEKRVGYSRPWENEARLLALKLRELLQPASRMSPDSVLGG